MSTSDHLAQEAAFFGMTPDELYAARLQAQYDSPSSNGGGVASSTSSSHPPLPPLVSDQERRDMELARRLQQQGSSSNVTSSSSPTRASNDVPPGFLTDQERADMELALRLQQQGSNSNLNASQLVSEQELRDQAFARRLQQQGSIPSLMDAAPPLTEQERRDMELAERLQRGEWDEEERALARRRRQRPTGPPGTATWTSYPQGFGAWSMARRGTTTPAANQEPWRSYYASQPHEEGEGVGYPQSPQQQQQPRRRQARRASDGGSLADSFSGIGSAGGICGVHDDDGRGSRLVGDRGGRQPMRRWSSNMAMDQHDAEEDMIDLASSAASEDFASRRAREEGRIIEGGSGGVSPDFSGEGGGGAGEQQDLHPAEMRRYRSAGPGGANGGDNNMQRPSRATARCTSEPINRGVRSSVVDPMANTGTSPAANIWIEDAAAGHQPNNGGGGKAKKGGTMRVGANNVFKKIVKGASTRRASSAVPSLAMRRNVSRGGGDAGAAAPAASGVERRARSQTPPRTRGGRRSPSPPSNSAEGGTNGSTRRPRPPLADRKAPPQPPSFPSSAAEAAAARSSSPGEGKDLLSSPSSEDLLGLNSERQGGIAHSNNGSRAAAAEGGGPGNPGDVFGVATNMWDNFIRSTGISNPVDYLDGGGGGTASGGDATDDPNSSNDEPASAAALASSGSGRGQKRSNRRRSATGGGGGGSGSNDRTPNGIRDFDVGGSFRASVTGDTATATSATRAASSGGGDADSGRSRGGRGRANVTVCSVCKEPAPSYLAALDRTYHRDCFRCMGCHDIIDPNVPFTYTTIEETGEKHPLHRKCYAELFGMKCTVCRETIPSDPSGKISYMKHPFFDSEIMCPTHKDTSRRCAGCHRFEPMEGGGFADLGDGNRCVCYSCCRSVIVDNEDAKPLWEMVLKFFEKRLALPVWEGMKAVPVLIVGHETLNDQQTTAGDSVHAGGGNQIMTRGLCLTEHSRASRRIGLMPRMKFDMWSKSFERLNIEKDEKHAIRADIVRGEANPTVTYFTVPQASDANKKSQVTAILCLSGLPGDLTASILAHEATHAWIKLHPAYRFDQPIPPQVEEGCCQLVAHLFLADGLDPPSNAEADDGGPTDERLRQYFRYSIETDVNEVYGDGFRKASQAYSKLGLELLLSHVVMYREFPNV